MIEDIKAAEKRLIQGLLDSDIDTLRELLLDDVVYINHNGQVVAKEVDLEIRRSGTLTVEKLIVTEQMIKLFDDQAIVSDKEYFAGKYSGRPYELLLRSTRVWKMFDGQWKIVAASSVRID